MKINGTDTKFERYSDSLWRGVGGEPMLQFLPQPASKTLIINKFSYSISIETAKLIAVIILPL